ncbi:C-type mannose receptor 2-like [Panulirus ornatus]|uniref:C-type mannose receptor 2-like n=1 Tax=Panulirus ornatus TaxID=150431 RepID=UPI003A850936
MTLKTLLLPLLLLLGTATLTSGQNCFHPFSEVGGQCLYLEYETLMSWQEARDYCRSMAGDGVEGDLASFPRCGDFTALARHLAFNANVNSSFWVGAHTLFTPNMWQWLSGESLQTGVPYWAYSEQYDNNEDCASVHGGYYYRLVPSLCDQRKGVVCSMPLINPGFQTHHDPEPRPGEDCPHEGIVIGKHCYKFESHAESWSSAEAKCREHHDKYSGMLYYPSDCEEFTNMAHHLEADESVNSYWVGAEDVSGQEEWTWVDGQLVPGGPPYWASGQPSHEHNNEPWEHCAVMDSEMRYYMRDVHCSDRHPYICKLTKNE